ncbi:two-component system sensor histidine kinase YesM [Lederbergia galactosidilyticus]|uniref:sensor histidine kinase n=1 Tax=Lederbergia galactosidilytica TaxID=217031 RepID=UPI001AE182B0|nr:two-component system sensor histidine kinase YesM [Lederbergia galactosidilytica]
MFKKTRLFALPSFRNKVILASVICIVLPVIITLSIYNYLTKDAMKEQAISNANKELELAEEYVLKLLEDMLNITNFVQLNTELNAILKEKAEQDDSSNQGYEQFLKDRTVMNTIENITLVGEKAQVTILLKNGKYYTNYSISDYNPLEIFQEDWFAQLDTKNGYESIWIDTAPTVFQSYQGTNPYQLSVARTLRNNNSEIYGYLVVTIFENTISQIFDNRLNDEEILLVNDENTILSHRDTDQIGKTFSYLNGLNKNETAIIDIENQHYLLTAKDISFNRWKLVSLVPYREAISNINSIFNKVFFLLLILFTIFFVILAYFINRITKPLVYLGSVVEKVQAGNLSVRSQIQTNDEIGRFSQSFDRMLDQINEMIKETKATQARKRKAELAMLQAQINPHFLFNVLNSIRMKVFKHGDKESAKMISSLSKLLRMTIDTQKGMIPFAEEVSIVSDYVFLMNMRQKEKVSFITNITNESYQHTIPRFILQPIIENSIIHGLNQKAGTITLHALTTKDKFIVEIEDDGQGMVKEKLLEIPKNIKLLGDKKRHQNSFSSIGLSNVYERLVMTFGKEFEMKVDSSEGKGTRIILLIPEKGVGIDV